MTGDISGHENTNDSAAVDLDPDAHSRPPRNARGRGRDRDNCGKVYTGPNQLADEVVGEGELLCEDPAEDEPIAVVLQARPVGTTRWTIVASGNGTGIARFTCTGVAATEYRLFQVPTRVRVFNCS